MLEILADRTYRHLFAVQAVALLGTGLATVALGLLAYDLAGDNAAMVLGTVFTIKIAAYVGIAPVAAAFAERVDRRALLVGLDVVRAAVGPPPNWWIPPLRRWTCPRIVDTASPCLELLHWLDTGETQNEACSASTVQGM